MLVDMKQFECDVRCVVDKHNGGLWMVWGAQVFVGEVCRDSGLVANWVLGF